MSSPTGAAPGKGRGELGGACGRACWHCFSELQTRVYEPCTSNGFKVVVTLLCVNLVASVSFPRSGDQRDPTVQVTPTLVKGTCAGSLSRAASCPARTGSLGCVYCILMFVFFRKWMVSK